MKRIGITQRVEYFKIHNETRDCLDQRWHKLLFELGYMLFPLPNIEPCNVALLVDALNLDAIILSGGNSITILDESASDVSFKRDLFESALLKEAIKRRLNILGVCRGMQMINVLLGGTLSKIPGHIGIRHTIQSLSKKYSFSNTVNSYHHWGILKSNLAKELKPLAIDLNGSVESFICNEKKILGIMWHPEREEPFDTNDIQLIKDFL